MPVKSTGVVALIAKGAEPAVSPLSYRQLKPIQGQFCRGWYCR